MLRRGVTALAAAAACATGVGGSAATLAQHALLCSAALAITTSRATQQPLFSSVWDSARALHASVAAMADRAGLQSAPGVASNVWQLPQHYMALDRLQPARGARKDAKRWGRGDSSDRGRYCGRGIKGQGSRGSEQLAPAPILPVQ